MSKYRIGQPDLNGKVWIEDMEAGKVFNGYDFMGSVNWEDYGGDAYWADPEEAEQIVADLESADEQTSKRINCGYEIIRSMKLDDSHEFVIGKAVDPKTPAQYVCWDCIGKNNYSNGEYGSTFRQALYSMAERIRGRYECLPREA